MVTDAEGHLFDMETDAEGHLMDDGRSIRRSVTQGSDSNDSGTKVHSWVALYQPVARDSPLPDPKVLAADMTTQDDQPAETEKDRSAHAEQRPEHGGPAHKEQQQLTPVNASPLDHSSSSRVPTCSALQPTGEMGALSSESPDRSWSKELHQQFQSALKQKLSRSDSTGISATSLMQWLQGTNRTRPCRLLSSLDTKALLAGLGQKQDFSLFLQSYPFLEWKVVQ
jgi:hypothetical protein